MQKENIDSSNPRPILRRERAARSTVLWGWRCSVAVLALALAPLAARAQTAGPPLAEKAPPSAGCTSPQDIWNTECPLTWHGITLYGAYDVGVGWVSHGLPENGYNYEGESLVNRNGNHSQFLIAPNNLSQTGLGIKGTEEFLPGWSAVFNASTGINPQSGQLANVAATNVINNGLPRGAYSYAGDGARAGQVFNDEIYAGVSSAAFGTLTFGRQRALGTDAMLAYDPAGGAYSFSFIGYNGLMAGGGDTEDTRWDDALKYRLAYGPVHFGAMYKFADGRAAATPPPPPGRPPPVRRKRRIMTPMASISAELPQVLGRCRRSSMSTRRSASSTPCWGLRVLTQPYQSTTNSINTNHHHRGQSDRNRQHRLRHRHRQHRGHGRRQICLGSVEVLWRLRIHPAT